MAKMEVVAPHYPQIAPSNSSSCRFSISIESIEELSSSRANLQHSIYKNNAEVNSTVKDEDRTDQGNAEVEEQEEDTTIVNSEAVHSALSENSCETSVIKSEIPNAKDLKQMDFLLKGLPTLGQIFELHHKIGEGTFSSVFLATLRGVPADVTFANKQFAIKHLIPTTHPSRAERELKCLQEIGGKDNVVGVHLCLRNEDFIAFVMPYLPHRRFSEYVLDMGVEETRLYMRNLLLALCRVHSFNIIHRDVKPSNFLYNRETKEFLLVDFGLSQPVEETTPPKVASQDGAATSKKRKRCDEPEMINTTVKSDNPNGTVVKLSFQSGMTENVAKRRALQPCNNNALNIIKTPEKEPKYQLDKKLIPSMASARARNLQNITNLSNNSNSLKAPKLSPTKEVLEVTSAKKTPRKGSYYICENLKSPAKTIDKTSLGTSDIWRNENSNKTKFAMGISKIKAEMEARRNGLKEPAQRKILFDDIPDPKPSASRFMAGSRSAAILRRSLQGNTTTAKKSPEPPRLVAQIISSVKSPTGPPPVLEKMVDCKTGTNGREFRTLVSDASKSPVPGSSVVRVQNSQVKSQQMSPVTPSETRRQLMQNARERDQQKVIFAKPQAPVHAPLPSATTSHCTCFGKPQVCSNCLTRKPQGAPRAGTPGFRPPEVLLRCPIQTTAVDMWAAGVILLCILSGCYPFFRSPDDLTALAEIMSVFGTDNLKEIAKLLGRFVVCSQPSKGLDLKKLCVRMRQRGKDRIRQEDGDRCSNCGQIICSESGCLCRADDINPLDVQPADLSNENKDDTFPDTAFHLLARLLDLNPETRITAAEALTHPFVNINV